MTFSLTPLWWRQITSLTIVYSTFYLGTHERKHQSSAPLAFLRGVHRWTVNSPYKWPVTRNMFPFDDVIMQFCFICVYHHSMSVTVIIQNTQFLNELISTCCENYRTSISIKNAVQNPSLWHFFNIVISVSTNKLNEKNDVGDPCLTPIIAVTMATHRILFVILYIAAMANNKTTH